MSEQEWQTYVDTGEIPIKHLKEIARRIKMGKSLSVKELSIYRTHHQIIESLLK